MVLSYAIDRFGGSDWVVLEDGAAHTFQVPRNWVPAGAREGDVLTFDLNAAGSAVTELRVAVDQDATAARRREAAQLRNDLPRGPKGDLSL